MNKKTNAGISPLLLIMICVTIITLIAYLLLTYFGLYDLRTTEQKRLDLKEELLSHSLSDVAIKFARDSYPTPISRISIFRVNSGNKQIFVRIDYSTGSTVCYSSIAANTYGIIPTENYELISRQLAPSSEFILEGERLAIIIEEARGN